MRHMHLAQACAVTSMATSCALAVVLLVPAQRVFASTAIRVDTVADSLAADGHCALREAILAANAGTSVDVCHGGRGTTAIELPAGHYTLSITGRDEDAGLSGDLDVTGRVSLEGAGAGRSVIDANGIDRVIDVAAAGRLSIAQVALTGGSGEAGRGGAGIFSAGTLVMHDVVVRGNIAADGAAGIAATGPTVISRSRIADNETYNASSSAKPHRDDPGVAAGIDSRQPLILRHSVVEHNIGRGEWTHGGISMRGGTITASTVRDNSAGDCGSGGVVMIWGLIERSTIADNRAGECDGAGGVVAIDSQIWNSTISGNIAGSSYSEPSGSMQVGGVLSDVSTIVGSTITGNVNLAPVGAWTGPGGLLARRLSPPAFAGNLSAIQDTILAGNRDATGAPSDCEGSVTSDGHNLVGSIAGCAYGARSSDLVGVAPRLGPLADNGGPTLTHAPRHNSLAIDAWAVSRLARDPACPLVDQRGIRRPQDGNGDGRLGCDIGAVELRR